MSVSRSRLSLDLHGVEKRCIDHWYAGGFSRKLDFQSERNLPALAGSGSAARCPQPRIIGNCFGGAQRLRHGFAGKHPEFSPIFGRKRPQPRQNIRWTQSRCDHGERERGTTSRPVPSPRARARSQAHFPPRHGGRFCRKGTMRSALG
jgi:hypothetical protein